MPGLQMSSDVVFPRHPVPLDVTYGQAQMVAGRKLMTTVNYTASSAHLALALSASPADIYTPANFSTYGSPTVSQGTRVTSAAYRGGAASTQSQPHPRGYYSQINFAESSLFTYLEPTTTALHFSLLFSSPLRDLPEEPSEVSPADAAMYAMGRDVVRVLGTSLGMCKLNC